MKIGLVARSENRGLGNLTWEWAQHMQPDRVLVVVPNHPITQRIGRYDDFDTTVIGWNHLHDSALDEPVVRGWLDSLDVVYSAETFYDWRMCDWARDAGVRTVCHAMPEYYRHALDARLPRPDAWWTPTRWRLSTLDPKTRVVPVPVAVERFEVPMFHVEHRLRSLHTVGTKAAADRNGTRILLGSLRYLVREHDVTIRTQGQLVGSGQPAHGVRVRLDTAEADEYWQLYGDADVLVLPRRYAGLSLPVLEAMAAGLAVVMPDVEPQRSEWPISAVPATEGGYVRTAAHRITLAEVSPRVLAARMDWLADHPDEVRALQHSSRRFAESQSWERLRPVIVDELERVCSA